MGLAVGLISVLLLLWDFITYPFYLIWDRPWRETRLIERTRARIVDSKPDEVTIEPLPIESKMKEKLQNAPEKINTMERLFKYSSKTYSDKKCLGTRTILGELEEKQESGKVFTKLHLGEYTWQTYNDVATQAENLGKGLRELGLSPKDKVVLYANTRAEWMISAIGAFKHSLAIVTIYTNLGEDGVQHGITQTEASTVIVEEDLLPRLLAVLPKAPSVKNVVVIPSHKAEPLPENTDTVSFHKFSSVLSTGSSSAQGESPPDPSDTAIIMYTSGSTGVPKGVVMTHSNLVNAIFSIIPTIGSVFDRGDKSQDCYIAILPLAHVLELLGENIMLVFGIPIGYSSTKTFTDTGTMVAKGSRGDATILQPTIVCLVPLVLETIYKGILANVANRGPFFAELVNFCYKYRLKWLRSGHTTPIMDKLIFAKMRASIGGRMRILLSGGAPLAPDAHDFCRTCLGITLLQGYGLTETCATASIPDGSDLSTGRVGPPLQDVNIRLVSWEEGGYRVTDSEGARGEIVIGGAHVAKEYYNLPDKTEEEFFEDAGKRWFKTGDIGQMMSDGTIKIIDRKKDLVKLQGGEYVSLGKVESLMKLHKGVENVCIYADPTRMHTVAMVIPTAVWLEEVQAKLGKAGLSRGDACRDPEIVDELTSALWKHGLNQRLEKFEVPKALFLVSEPWTPESGLITSAFKLKRKALENVYQDAITDMYDKNNNQAGPKKIVNDTSQPKPHVAS